MYRARAQMRTPSPPITLRRPCVQVGAYMITCEPRKSRDDHRWAGHACTSYMLRSAIESSSLLFLFILPKALRPAAHAFRVGGDSCWEDPTRAAAYTRASSPARGDAPSPKGPLEHLETDGEVRLGEERDRQVGVQAICDQRGRRRVEEARERAAPSLAVVLVDHHHWHVARVGRADLRLEAHRVGRLAEGHLVEVQQEEVLHPPPRRAILPALTARPVPRLVGRELEGHARRRCLAHAARRRPRAALRRRVLLVDDAHRRHVHLRVLDAHRRRRRPLELVGEAAVRLGHLVGHLRRVRHSAAGVHRHQVGRHRRAGVGEGVDEQRRRGVGVRLLGDRALHVHGDLVLLHAHAALVERLGLAEERLVRRVVEKHRVEHHAKAHQLEVEQPVPLHDRPDALPEERRADVDGARVAQLVERLAAARLVRLVHAQQRLLVYGGAQLSQAVARGEVVAREEGEDHDALLDVRLERRDVGEVVDVEEDDHRGEHRLQPPLDHRRLVLCGGPHVRDEEVVREVLLQL
mmetsp:Transcript_14380/g.34182  ORF Transcript_14380/g.34182 Transcript_14380/m.34182 type:complete len:521 (+) Transcript_14380:3-1565(+)